MLIDIFAQPDNDALLYNKCLFYELNPYDKNYQISIWE